MNGPVLLDAGPLVAFLNLRDYHNLWTMEQVGGIRPPLLTCEPVLSEASFLLRHITGGATRILDLVRKGHVQVPFRLQDESAGVSELLAKYAGIPMSLADACLVRMAELNPGSTVLTVDSDFRIYRMHGRQVIPTIMPGK